MSRLALFLGVAAVLGLYAYTGWQSARIAGRFPPQGVFVDVAGGRLHLVDKMPQGEPRATVLLIHGASGNLGDMMLNLGPRLLQHGFRVVAVDRPGQGWSDRPDGTADASPARQVQLIRQAMDKIGVKQAIVLGHSLGGMAAINFALDQTDFTQALVLVAPVSHPWPGGVAWYYHAAAAPVLGQVFTRLFSLPIGIVSLKSGVAHVFAPQAAPAGFLHATGVGLVLRPASFMANAQDVAAAHGFVTLQAPRMKDIAVPTGIVTGDSDDIVLTKIHSFGSARDIPGAKLTVLAGVGHAPHNSDPDAVVKVVEEVAARVAAARTSGPAGATALEPAR